MARRTNGDPRPIVCRVDGARSSARNACSTGPIHCPRRCDCRRTPYPTAAATGRPLPVHVLLRRAKSTGSVSRWPEHGQEHLGRVSLQWSRAEAGLVPWRPEWALGASGD